MRCVPSIPAASQDAALREVIDSIAVRTGTLLEIVNYNVEIGRIGYFASLTLCRANNTSALASL
jgi:hypothetical protein